MTERNHDNDPLGSASGPVRRRGLMLVLSSPSGAGKTTISRALLDRDDNLSMSVSVTTRIMRPGEREGIDYSFISRERFDAMVRDHDLLEYAEVFGNAYGTPKAEVDSLLAGGRDVLFDIDWQGTQQLAESARDDLVSVFVLPPSHDELERRLRARGQDTDDVIATRMEKAADEMSHYFDYDYVIVNEDLNASIAAVESVLQAERLRRTRQIGLSGFVKSLQGRDQGRI
ncbi:guanylate kinase [Fodinicurvata sp. EGI_FJ10296]|uniref:guanylate kinase n=1 Tax=Fodinicurvata sp. EGI_FJ10296 TaxID=3231908 RepID=UPI003454FF2C